LVVFEELHALEGSGACNELMGQLGFTLGLVVTSIVVIDLLMVILSVV
jgi:hypothetical protein